MNLELERGLEVGKYYKNIRELCEVTGLKYSDSSNSRQAVLKRIGFYYKLERKGNGYLVLEKYNDPEFIKNKIYESDKRKFNGGNHRTKKKYKNFLVSEEDESKIGIYKIVLNNDIYIGSTTQGFRQRFKGHKTNKKMITYNMLKDGATFEVIEICEGLTEPEIREIENKYIHQYKEDVNWNLININDAWSFTKKTRTKQKYKIIKIKVKNSEYENALKFLKGSYLNRYIL